MIKTLCTFYLLLFFGFYIHAQEVQFLFKTSPKLESFLLLDAFSRSLEFNQEEQVTLEFWSELLTKNPDAQKAVALWSGQATLLSLLFSVIDEDSFSALVDMLENFDKTFTRMTELFQGDEALALRKLKLQYPLLLEYIHFLKKHRFAEKWDSEYKQKTLVPRILKLQETVLAPVDPLQLWKELKIFAPEELGNSSLRLKVYVVTFGVQHFQKMRDSKWVISLDMLDQFPLLLPYEVCREQVYSDRSKTFPQEIAKGDAFYQKAYTRIYETLKKDPTEEYRLASALYIGVKSNLITRKQALTKLKYAFPDPKESQKTGAPLATWILKSCGMPILLQNFAILSLLKISMIPKESLKAISNATSKAFSKKFLAL